MAGEAWKKLKSDLVDYDVNLELPHEKDALIVAHLDELLSEGRPAIFCAGRKCNAAEENALSCFAYRMASLARIRNDSRLLFYGLIAISLPSMLRDIREYSIVLALIHYSANRMGIDATSLFSEASTRMHRSGKRLLLNYARNMRTTINPSAYGISEKTQATGLLYEVDIATIRN